MLYAYTHGSCVIDADFSRVACLFLQYLLYEIFLERQKVIK